MSPSTAVVNGCRALMASTHAGPALRTRIALHSAGARLALMSALGWLADQPSFASRADHFFLVIATGIRWLMLALVRGTETSF
jgi:hypothetical protein